MVPCTAGSNPATPASLQWFLDFDVVVRDALEVAGDREPAPWQPAAWAGAKPFERGLPRIVPLMTGDIGPVCYCASLSWDGGATVASSDKLPGAAAMEQQETGLTWPVQFGPTTAH